jgi:hypothetical protein
MMSVEGIESVQIIDRPTMPCGVCHAQVTELRRGRCWGCYTRWGEARPVGTGAACSVCGERRRTELRMVELHARSHAICHSCTGKISRLRTIPNTIPAIRELLTRERRAAERRAGSEDRRIFPRERRVGDRRSAPRPIESQDTAPQVGAPGAAAPEFAHDLAHDFVDMVIELAEGDIEASEQTVVREQT